MIMLLHELRQKPMILRMYGRGCSTFLDMSEANREAQKGARMRCIPSIWPECPTSSG